MSCVPRPYTNQLPCCVASLTLTIGNFTSASLYRIDTLRPSCDEKVERLPVAASTASPVAVVRRTGCTSWSSTALSLYPLGKTLAPAQLSIETRRCRLGVCAQSEPRSGTTRILFFDVFLGGVRIHASSFCAVARRKRVDVDCSTRGRAPSCGAIVLLVDCPASAAVAAATGRPSASVRSFCRLRQSDLTCSFFLQ